MNQKRILKAIAVIIVTLALVLSGSAFAKSIIVVTAEDEQTPTLTTKIKGTALTTLETVFWDNGMDFDKKMAAQIGAICGGEFDCRQADDFLFEEDTEVFDVHWIGGYWNTGYNRVHWPWEIIFWLDDGTGNAPGTMITSFMFNASEYTETFIEENPGWSIVYEFSADLPNTVNFTAGQKYWITIWAYGDAPPQSGWGSHRTILLHQAVWWSDYFGFPPWTDGEHTDVGYPHDMCFQLTGEGEPAIPDLDCEGDILWEDVAPGDTVTDTFTVSNIGDVGSFLNWEIESYPDWGNWTFDPDSGIGLPDGDSITVDVEVIAPDEENTEFTGEIVLINSDDPDDTCIIEITLVTPCNLDVGHIWLRGWLFCMYEIGIGLLTYVFGFFE